MLRQYLPESMTVGTGQIANASGDLSPQIDVLIYSAMTFPRLAVHEDGSVIVCCESVYATVECKSKWHKETVVRHLEALKPIDAQRHEWFGPVRDGLPGYFVLVVDSKRTVPPMELQDEGRFVGVYSLRSGVSWRSRIGEPHFEQRSGNALDHFLSDVLSVTMQVEMEVGTLENTREAVDRYFGWREHP